MNVYDWLKEMERLNSLTSESPKYCSENDVINALVLPSGNVQLSIKNLESMGIKYFYIQHKELVNFSRWVLETFEPKGG